MNTRADTDIERDLYALRSGGRSASDVRQIVERSRPWYTHFLRDWLPTNPQASILDIPCGHGNLLHCLQELGFVNVRGFDSDEGQVHLAQELGLAAQVGDAFAELARVRPGSVSRIFSLDFLEHLSKQQAVEFCQLAHTALEQGGLLLCRTPSADGPFGSSDRYNDLTHKWAMTAGASHALLRLAGFADVTVRDEAPVPYKWTNRLRRVLYESTKLVVGSYLELVGIGAPAIWTRSMWLVARKH